MSTGTFYPRYAFITAITKGFNTTVTFDDEHDFTDGEILSFRVSPPYGMVQLNNRQGRVLSHTSDTVIVDIESTNFNSFVDAGNEEQYRAMAVPAASGIVPNQYSPSVNLEDSFDHRPP